jgi:hypothetical protein
MSQAQAQLTRHLPHHGNPTNVYIARETERASTYIRISVNSNCMHSEHVLMNDMIWKQVSPVRESDSGQCRLTLTRSFITCGQSRMGILRSGIDVDSVTQFYFDTSRPLSSVNHLTRLLRNMRQEFFSILGLTNANM